MCNIFACMSHLLGWGPPAFPFQWRALGPLEATCDYLGLLLANRVRQSWEPPGLWGYLGLPLAAKSGTRVSQALLLQSSKEPYHTTLPSAAEKTLGRNHFCVEMCAEMYAERHAEMCAEMFAEMHAEKCAEICRRPPKGIQSEPSHEHKLL